LATPDLLVSLEGAALAKRYVTEGEGVPPSVAPLSAAVVAGDLCFVSGQTAIDPVTGEFHPGTIEEEFAIAFANVLAVVRAAGFEGKDLVYVHLALADIDDYSAVNKVYGETLALADLPARMTYAVGALPFGAKIEVQAIAARS
jgi:2-iminobutanoate/2-iminopropanoate deaminase